MPPLVKTDTLLKTQEGIQDVLVKEESTGYARAEEQLSSEEAESYRRQMGDKFCAMVVSNFGYTAGRVFKNKDENLFQLKLFTLLHIMCGYQCVKTVSKNDTREVI